MVGPTDLAYSLGLQPPDLLGHPKAEEAIQFILDKCKEHGVPWGMFTSTVPTAEKWLRRGGQIVTADSDFGFVLDGAERTVGDMRKVLASL